MDSGSPRPIYLQRPGLVVGLASGLLSAALLYLVYGMDRGNILNGHLLFLPYLPLLLGSVLAGHLRKRSNGGRISLQGAILPSFGAFALGLLVNTIALLLLTLAFDPKLTTDLIELSRRRELESFTDAALRARKEGFFNASLQSQGATVWMLKSGAATYFFGTLFGLIFSIVSAAIIKKDVGAKN